MAARSRKRREASLARADGVVFDFNKIPLEFDHHPVRSIKEASRHFIEVASTPPQRGGENGGPLRFGNSPVRPGTSRDKGDGGPEGRKIDSHKSYAPTGLGSWRI